jgi:hypothetical protein
VLAPALRKNSLNEGHGFSRAIKYAIGEGFTRCGKTLCTKGTAYSLGKNSLLDRTRTLVELCQPRTSVRGAGFQTRENPSSCNGRALALVRTANEPPLSYFVSGHDLNSLRKLMFLKGTAFRPYVNALQ